MLLDSNIFIYTVQPRFQQLRNWCMQTGVTISDITRLEVLGCHQLTKDDKEDFIALFDYAKVYPVSLLPRSCVNAPLSVPLDKPFKGAYSVGMFRTPYPIKHEFIEI